MEEPDQKKNVQLKKELGLISAVGLIISSMIGSGIFISPSYVLHKVGSKWLSLIIWALCGLMSFLGALVFGELGGVVGESGGAYACFQASFGKLGSGKTFFGPLPAFLYCFISVVLLRPAGTAALLLTSSEYVVAMFEEHYTVDDVIFYRRILALFGLVIITIVTSVSVRWSVIMLNTFSSLKVVACLLIISGGIYYLSIGHTENIIRGFEGTKTSFKDVSLAFYGGLWAYDGWAAVTEVTEEVSSPRRNIPLSIMLSVPAVTVLYLLVNVAYMSVLSVPEIIQSQAVAIDFAERLYSPLTVIISITVVLSTYSCAMGGHFGVSRLYYAAAKNGHMIEALCYINKKTSTPTPAILLHSILAAAYIFSASRIMQLIEFINYVLWIFYGLGMISFFIVRKTMASTPRLYKVPLIIPVLLLAMSVFLTVMPLAYHPDIHFLFAVGAILLGITVYYIAVYKELHFLYMEKFNQGIKTIFGVESPKEFN